MLSTNALSAAFAVADSDHDGKLSLQEFTRATAELGSLQAAQTMADDEPGAVHRSAATAGLPTSSAGQVRVYPAPGKPEHASAPVDGAIGGASAEPAGLPQCSILFFFHIVKTAGTTMRTVLQRQAQLGEFEYLYSDTTKKPRWQLIMHQLRQRVTHRRLIIELHSEWGLPRSFYADVRLLQELYEPLGCKVTLATVLRHPFSFYLSWFNWRASNYMPLCTWDPPRDPQSRQLTGYGLPFVTRRLPAERGGRTLEIPVCRRSLRLLPTRSCSSTPSTFSPTPYCQPHQLHPLSSPP